MNTTGMLCQAQNRIYFSTPHFFPFPNFPIFYFIFLRLPIFLVLTTTLQAVSRLRAERHRGQLHVKRQTRATMGNYPHYP